MMSEVSTILETKIWNRHREPVRVYDPEGHMVCVVLPDQIEIIESKSDRTLYARYSEVIFEENGGVSLTVRPNWVDPDHKEPWLLVLENIDGREVEQRMIGGKPVFIPRGIPVRLWLESREPNAVNEKITIKRIKERLKCPDWPGYWIWKETVKDTPSPRPQIEVDQIAEDLKTREVAA